MGYWHLPAVVGKGLGRFPENTLGGRGETCSFLVSSRSPVPLGALGMVPADPQGSGAEEGPVSLPGTESFPSCCCFSARLTLVSTSQKQGQVQSGGWEPPALPAPGVMLPYLWVATIRRV